MTDDETFIRAILARPGDDTPRLAYADWLDDRGDRRRSYLRAERAAVVTGDVAALRERAVGLDPVWVARVSRPPAGVCVEHVEFTSRGPVLDQEAIRRFENSYSIVLPAQYRAFLLNYNGGEVSREYAIGTRGYAAAPNPHYFFQLVGESVLGLARSARRRIHSPDRYLEEQVDFLRDLITARYHVPGRDPVMHPQVEEWLLNFLRIGECGFGLLLGIAGPQLGQVMYFDYDGAHETWLPDNLPRPYASSFAEFLLELPDTGYP